MNELVIGKSDLSVLVRDGTSHVTGISADRKRLECCKFGVAVKYG